MFRHTPPYTRTHALSKGPGYLTHASFQYLREGVNGVDGVLGKQRIVHVRHPNLHCSAVRVGVFGKVSVSGTRLIRVRKESRSHERNDSLGGLIALRSSAFDTDCGALSAWQIEGGV